MDAPLFPAAKSETQSASNQPAIVRQTEREMAARAAVINQQSTGALGQPPVQSGSSFPRVIRDSAQAIPMPRPADMPPPSGSRGMSQDATPLFPAARSSDKQ